MNIFNAEAQSKAFVKARLPIFVFGLLIFAQGALEPVNENLHMVASWAKVLPLLAAMYLIVNDNLPTMFESHMDEYTQQSEMVARTNAGIAAMVFLILTLALEPLQLWRYANAVDCVAGFYMMFYSGTVLFKMRDN